MNALTLQELRLSHARLAHRAERLRQEQRHTTATSSKALALAKEIRTVQERADDYAEILAAFETKETRKTA